MSSSARSIRAPIIVLTWRSRSVDPGVLDLSIKSQFWIPCALAPAVSFSAVARLLAREQLPRHLLHEKLLLAPQRKRSGAPDPVCEANTEDTVRYGRHAFFACLPYSQVCAREVHGWALESGKAGGIRANSSWYRGCSTHLRASSTCVLLAFRPSEPGRDT